VRVGVALVGFKPLLGATIGKAPLSAQLMLSLRSRLGRGDTRWRGGSALLLLAGSRVEGRRQGPSSAAAPRVMAAIGIGAPRARHPPRPAPAAILAPADADTIFPVSSHLASTIILRGHLVCHRW
jgi:hypothetical protein